MTHDRSILGVLQAAVAQGRCDENSYKLLAAECCRMLGMYSKGLGILSGLGSGLPLQIRRRVEMERAHIGALLYGDSVARSESKRLKRDFPGDSIAGTFSDYLPFVKKKPDVPDTLLPKEATSPVRPEISLRNFPNPFYPTTTVEYFIPAEDRVLVTVEDAYGRRIAVVKDEIQPAGIHVSRFDCPECRCGVYVIRMQTGSQTICRRILLLK